VAILSGVLATALLSFVTRVAPAPAGWISRPPSLQPVFFQFNLHSLFTWGFFPVVLTIFVMAFVDTMGTLIGVSARAGFLDKDGNLPQIERPMMGRRAGHDLCGDDWDQRHPALISSRPRESKPVAAPD